MRPTRAMSQAAASSIEQHRLRATLIGFIAVLLWATLALFTTATGRVPPFLLLKIGRAHV